MTLTVLGEPLMIDDGIRCVTIAEAEKTLPSISQTRTVNGRTSIESGAEITGVFWIGRGKRPSLSS